jgi:cytochrome P450
LGGIVWEEDPVRHREVAKKLSPAFSNRSIKALEPVAHKYMVYFVAKMKELGSEPTGVGLVQWTNWLAMDQAVDMAWNEKLRQMRDRSLSQESRASIVSRS